MLQPRTRDPGVPDGTQHLELGVNELLERLAALILPFSDIDQSVAFDLTDPAPVPEYEFDHTVSL